VKDGEDIKKTIKGGWRLVKKGKERREKEG